MPITAKLGWENRTGGLPYWLGSVKSGRPPGEEAGRESPVEERGGREPDTPLCYEFNREALSHSCSRCATVAPICAPRLEAQWPGVDDRQSFRPMAHAEASRSTGGCARPPRPPSFKSVWRGSFLFFGRATLMLSTHDISQLC